MLHSGDYDDDSESWFYADGKGSLYAGKLKEINGKRYAFDSVGRMKSGFRLVKAGATSSDIADIVGLDNTDRGYHVVDTEEDFLKYINTWLEDGYKLYNFGSGDDGAMKTGKQTLALDGENFTFSFGKSGSSRGAGKNGIDSGKIYQGGMLLKADKEEKYAVVMVGTNSEGDDEYTLYDTESFLASDYVTDNDPDFNATKEEKSWILDPTTTTGLDFKLINTSGTIQKTKTSAKDGEDNVYEVRNEVIQRISIKK